MIEKTIEGKTYRFRSMKTTKDSGEYGCDKCSAHGDCHLCNSLGDDCLDADGSYWKEHIKIPLKQT